MDENSTSARETVYPLHMFDCTKLNRTTVHWILHFNDILDTQMLESAFIKLLSTGDWRKLAGRLRRKASDSKKYEIYVPDHFSKDSPAVHFVHECMPNTKIAQHPEAKHLPKSANEPSLQMCAVDWRSLSPEMPAFDRMVNSDCPLIWIRATTFADATVLGIAFCHVIMDAAAGKSLLRAWSLILNGVEDNIPAVLGSQKDILETVIDNAIAVSEPQEQMRVKDGHRFNIEQRRATGFAFLLWILRHIWEWLTNPATMGIICLPPGSVSALRHKAESDLTSGTFISDHDVLTSWIVRSSALSESRIRPLCVIQAANLRYLIPSLAESNGVYLQNLVVAVWIFVSSRQAQKSLGEIASSNREQLLAQTADKQIISGLTTKRDDIRTSGNPCLFYGETNVNVLVMNNLTRLRIMHEVDFSAAVIRRGEEAGNSLNPAGSMVGFITSSNNVLRGPSFLTVTGRDYGGNVWLHGALRRKVWAKLEDDLTRLNHN